MLEGKGEDLVQYEDEALLNLPTFLKEPHNWGIRVKDVKKLFEYMKPDLFDYCKEERALGEDFIENLHVVTPRFVKPWTLDFLPYGLTSVMNADELITVK